MEYEFQHGIALLSRMPAVLDGLLRGLPDGWTRRDEGEGTWTVYDVLGHLNHCERVDWMRRTKTILEHGETETFAPLDRAKHMQDERVLSVEDLLDEFAELRAKNLDELRAMKLGAKELELRGVHPAFGPVTLAQLLATWATHDLTHLHQISRIMAHQYRDAVGPWRAYLGVLQCNGHSSS